MLGKLLIWVSQADSVRVISLLEGARREGLFKKMNADHNSGPVDKPSCRCWITTRTETREEAKVLVLKVLSRVPIDPSQLVKVIWYDFYNPFCMSFFRPPLNPGADWRVEDWAGSGVPKKLGPFAPHTSVGAR